MTKSGQSGNWGGVVMGVVSGGKDGTCVSCILSILMVNRIE